MFCGLGMIEMVCECKVLAQI
uniref:Uncharacterized protein n=1 Tax=Arundo donax TaxID=35708 RepID=A0A0A9BAK7_ARUDO